MIKLNISFANKAIQPIKAAGHTLTLAIFNLVTKMAKQHPDAFDAPEVLTGIASMADENEYKFENAEHPEDNFTITKEVKENKNVLEPVVNKPVTSETAPAIVEVV